MLQLLLHVTSQVWSFSVSCHFVVVWAILACVWLEGREWKMTSMEVRGLGIYEYISTYCGLYMDIYPCTVGYIWIHIHLLWVIYEYISTYCRLYMNTCPRIVGLLNILKHPAGARAKNVFRLTYTRTIGRTRGPTDVHRTISRTRRPTDVYPYHRPHKRTDWRTPVPSAA